MTPRRLWDRSSRDCIWSWRSGRSNSRKGPTQLELVEAGVDRVARKVLEEAGELAFIAKDRAAGRGSPTRVAEEAADLLYHLLVLLQVSEVPTGAVAAVLEERSR